MVRSTRLRSLLAICIVMALTGCDGGRPWYSVSGSVKFKKDGSLANFGSIEFRSEAEPIVVARSKIEKDGTFRLASGGRDGTVGGWHTVVVLMPVQTLGGGKTHSHGLDAATKYRDHRTTDLRIEITEDTADDFVLEIDDEKLSY